MLRRAESLACSLTCSAPCSVQLSLLEFTHMRHQTEPSTQTQLLWAEHLWQFAQIQTQSDATFRAMAVTAKPQAHSLRKFSEDFRRNGAEGHVHPGFEAAGRFELAEVVWFSGLVAPFGALGWVFNSKNGQPNRLPLSYQGHWAGYAD